MDSSLIASALGVLACAIVVALAAAWGFERRRYQRSELERAHLERDLQSAQHSMNDSERRMSEHRESAQLARVAMVGELSTALTQELNQPLTAIRSNAQAAQRMLHADQMDLHELYALLSDIVAADKRVGSVIERLRALLSSPETQASAVDFAELAREVLALAHSRFVASNITVTACLSATVPPVLADRLQIQQVLLNLFLNAIDAMLAQGTSDLRRLTLATTLANDDSVLVTISDTGPTILAAGNEALLDARTITGVSRPDLSISKSIIAAHGGRMWAINNPGSGATFCFTLPVAPARRESSAAGTTVRGLAAVCLLTLGFIHAANAHREHTLCQDADGLWLVDPDAKPNNRNSKRGTS